MKGLFGKLGERAEIRDGFGTERPHGPWFRGAGHHCSSVWSAGYSASQKVNSLFTNLFMAYKVAYLQSLLIKVPGLELSKEISLMTEVSHCFFALGWFFFYSYLALHLQYYAKRGEYYEGHMGKFNWCQHLTYLCNIFVPGYVVPLA